ncbi:PucR family transcriptional regulator [Amycolatopsis echigonensis]
MNQDARSDAGGQQRDPAGPGIRLDEVLRWGRLATATLLGGETALDRQATRVLIAPTGRSREGDFAGAIVLLDGRELALDTYLVDVTLRWMGEAGAVMLVVVSPEQPPGIASCRLADRSGVALVETADSVLDLADALRELVEAPQRVLARVIVDAVDKLAHLSPSSGVAGVLDVVRQALGAQVSLIAAEGELLAGDLLSPPLLRKDQVNVQLSTVVGKTHRFTQPVTLASGERPSFWIVAELEAPGEVRTSATRSLLKIGGSYVANRLISDRLEQERDARARLGVLNAIMATAGRPSAALVQQVATLGWITDGWATAVHLRIAGPVDSMQILALTDPVRALLAESGFDGPLVERSDGWTTWTVRLVEPPAASFAHDTAAVRQAVRRFMESRDHLRVYAGIGRPYLGLQGLKRSLAEAHEAMTIAQGTGSRSGVQHIDEVGLQRILVGWYSSEESRDLARSLLRPVLEIDRQEELLSTLEVFLDNESSPTVTAEILGVHRNTVVNRISRAKSVLSADLDDPDERLAVQLACRLAKLRG